MRKIVVLLVLVLGLLAQAPAQAAPKSHQGSFTFVRYGPNFLHRVFLEVESTNHGDKSCDVTLNGRVQSVDLGTDGKSERFNMFFLFTHGAAKAYEQARTAPSPTRRISCSH